MRGGERVEPIDESDLSQTIKDLVRTRNEGAEQASTMIRATYLRGPRLVDMTERLASGRFGVVSFGPSNCVSTISDQVPL